MRVKQIQRKEPALVFPSHPLKIGWVHGAEMKALRTFTLDIYRVRSDTRDGANRQKVGATKMSKRGDERFFVVSFFIPEAGKRGQFCTDVDLIHRREQVHPRITCRKCSRVLRK